MRSSLYRNARAGLPIPGSGVNDAYQSVMRRPPVALPMRSTAPERSDEGVFPFNAFLIGSLRSIASAKRGPESPAMRAAGFGIRLHLLSSACGDFRETTLRDQRAVHIEILSDALGGEYVAAEFDGFGEHRHREDAVIRVIHP